MASECKTWMLLSSKKMETWKRRVKTIWHPINCWVQENVVPFLQRRWNDAHPEAPADPTQVAAFGSLGTNTAHILCRWRTPSKAWQQSRAQPSTWRMGGKGEQTSLAQGSRVCIIPFRAAKDYGAKRKGRDSSAKPTDSAWICLHPNRGYQTKWEVLREWIIKRNWDKMHGTRTQPTSFPFFLPLPSLSSSLPPFLLSFKTGSGL